MKPSIQATSAALLAAGSISTAHAGPSYIAPTIDLTNKAVLAQLCKDTKNISGISVDGKDLCQVSPDGGKTWIWIPVGIAALLGGGAYLIRRKKKSEKTEDAPLDDGPTPHTPDISVDFEDTFQPAPVDETPSAPGVVIDPIESVDTPEELVTEDVVKTPEEILIDRAKNDPRFVVEDNKIKSVTIGTKTFEISDWKIRGPEMDLPDLNIVFYVHGSEQIKLMEEFTTLIVEYAQDINDPNHNIIKSHTVDVYELIDENGNQVGHIPGGVVKEYTILYIKNDGTLFIRDGRKYNEDGDLVEEYDSLGKVKTPPENTANEVADILAPDTTSPTPTPATTSPTPTPDMVDAPSVEQDPPEAPTPIEQPASEEVTRVEESAPTPDTVDAPTVKQAHPEAPASTEQPTEGISTVEQAPTPEEVDLPLDFSPEVTTQSEGTSVTAEKGAEAPAGTNTEVSEQSQVVAPAPTPALPETPAEKKSLWRRLIGR